MMIKLNLNWILIVLLNQLFNSVHNVEIISNLKDNLSGTLYNVFKSDLNEEIKYQNESSIKCQREFLRQNLIELLFQEINLSSKIISSKCFNSLNNFKFNLDNGTSWAFKSRFRERELIILY